VDRGGALAASVGTMLLLPPEDRARVAGFVFNKFRGDMSILQPGLAVVTERTGVPVLGVIPYQEGLRLAEEDGVALEQAKAGVRDGRLLQIRVVALPHISNFTDFDVFSGEEDVSLTYVTSVSELDGVDAVILPGTKNSMRDLAYLRERGLDRAMQNLVKGGTTVVGICGGYQLMGRTLEDPEGEESGGAATVQQGLDLLAVSTRFYPQKEVTRTAGTSLLPFAEGEPVSGYEIHMGQTRADSGIPAVIARQDGGTDGAVSACGNAWGTYLHGVFDAPGFRRAWLNVLRERRGWQPLGTAALQDRYTRFDQLADTVRAALDMDAVYRLTGLSGPKRGLR
jgi:adenosylcobyric acid synthase